MDSAWASSEFWLFGSLPGGRNCSAAVIGESLVLRVDNRIGRPTAAVPEARGRAASSLPDGKNCSAGMTGARPAHQARSHNYFCYCSTFREKVNPQ